MSTNKLPKIPNIRNVAKDNTNFPLPEQLVTNKTETITRRQIQDKNREQPFHPDPFLGLLQDLQTIYDQKVQKLTQLLNLR